MKFLSTVTAIALLSVPASGFVISSGPAVRNVEVFSASSPYYMDEIASEVKETKREPAPVLRKMPPKKSNPAHKEGVFSPLVVLAKTLVGEQTINKIRAKFITYHADVIGSFVDTHDSPVGKTVSKQIFTSMDRNNDGVVDEKELAVAFETLGFTWLKEKQVAGIMKRTDKDANGLIDYNEFELALPKTLRVNLVKLAKKNGADMGLLV
mmetsp:Transcript_10898/g.15871  ORF Transcript_10898/g.15871 Transcript_10898/m.15871 type:complete len:209 (-) Transcript_10898:111-737(-)|eukprot:CAMPEP_0197236602 /NCGR_PEP_ID=MMETSP1429-20130617/3653_1 /TAXON_ID=49237 /ORGANISM="Chaetoceros  sp., Strain UNC1202" /LENGTH=208 /DNA_ID=CAMNT_0042695411 /DNA_START=41 /DNA_END=667 /DNA_ORIENTATION=-